jgi:hypothetical protein
MASRGLSLTSDNVLGILKLCQNASLAEVSTRYNITEVEINRWIWGEAYSDILDIELARTIVQSRFRDKRDIRNITSQDLRDILEARCVYSLDVVSKKFGISKKALIRIFRTLARSADLEIIALLKKISEKKYLKPTAKDRSIYYDLHRKIHFVYAGTATACGVHEATNNFTSSTDILLVTCGNCNRRYSQYPDTISYKAFMENNKNG